jgi:hypothetical protein
VTRRQKGDLLSWSIVALIGLFAYSAFRDHDMIKITLIVSIALMIISWIIAMELPTKCGVTTRRGGRCRLDAKGVIFGCKQWHYWEKARARWGKRQQVWHHSQITGGQGREGRANGSQVVTVRIEEDIKSRITFQCTLITTACTLLTTVLAIVTQTRP